MTSLKTFALAGFLAVFAPFISTAHADTVGCDCSYKGHNTYKAAHWEKTVKDLTVWTATHPKHHPYYNTMRKKLVRAESNWRASKKTGHYGKKHHKHHRYCKVDVSPS